MGTNVNDLLSLKEFCTLNGLSYGRVRRFAHQNGVVGIQKVLGRWSVDTSVVNATDVKKVLPKKRTRTSGPDGTVRCIVYLTPKEIAQFEQMGRPLINTVKRRARRKREKENEK